MMSLTSILESVTKDRVLELANQSDDWSAVVPEYQVPLWQLFLIPNFQFEDWKTIPNWEEKLLTVDWKAIIPEGQFQGACFAWYLLQLPESNHHLSTCDFTDQLNCVDWNNAPTAGPLSSYTLGWAILLRHKVMWMAMHPYQTAAQHKQAILNCNWDQKGPDEWSDVTFAWKLEYEYRGPLSGSKLHQYSPKKTNECDWTVAPKSGPNQGMSLGCLLSSSIRIDNENLTKLMTCDWNSFPTGKSSIGWQVALNLASSETAQVALEKLLECDWNHYPTSGDYRDLTLGCLLMIDRKVRECILKDPRFKAKLLTCDWGRSPTNPSYQHHQKSLAWWLAEDDQLFNSLIQDPELEQAFLAVDWNEIPSYKGNFYYFGSGSIQDRNGLIPSESIAHFVLAHPIKFQWFMNSKAAQAKILLCHWDATGVPVNGASSENARPVKSLFVLLWSQAESQKLLLTDPKWIRRLCQCDMKRNHQYPGAEHSSLGDLVARQTQTGTLPSALLFKLTQSGVSKYDETKREFISYSEILRQQNAEYSHIPALQLEYDPSQDYRLGWEMKDQIQKQRKEVLMLMGQFSSFVDTYSRRYGRNFPIEIKKILFNALVTSVFPDVTDFRITEQAFYLWQKWDANQAQPKLAETSEGKLASLMMYQKRRQCGALWTLSGEEEKASMTRLGNHLRNVTPKVGYAKEALLVLGSRYDIHTLSDEALAAEITTDVIAHEINLQNGRPETLDDKQQKSQDEFSKLKFTLSQTLNKALSKKYRWLQESSVNSSRFFTPFHGQRAQALAKALQAAASTEDMKAILQNQIDIYDHPKSRRKLPVITDTNVATRLQDNFKRHPFKGIRGYYAMLNGLMKMVEQHEATLTSVSHHVPNLDSAQNALKLSNMTQ